MIPDKAILAALSRRPKGLLTTQLQALFIKEGILPAGPAAWDDLAELVRLLVGLEEKGKVKGSAEVSVMAKGDGGGDIEVVSASVVGMRWTWVKPKAPIQNPDTGARR